MVFEKESISDKLHKSDDDAIKPKVPHEWGSDQVCIFMVEEALTMFMMLFSTA